MHGNITTRQKCPECNGPLAYDERRGNCFCLEHPHICATGGYRVRMGRNHNKSFANDIRKAEQHLSFIRCQVGKPEIFGQYDPRDWQKGSPLCLESLCKSWIAKKKATRPPLTDGRINQVETAAKRITEFWGNWSIKTLTDIELAKFQSHSHIDIRDWNKTEDRQRLLGEKSVFDLCNVVQEFLNWGRKVAGVDPIRFEDMGYTCNETEPISIGQQLDIIEWLKGNCPEKKIWFAIQSLARNPNVRLGEFCAVRWDHINPFSKIIYVHKRKSRRKIGRRALQPKVIFMTDEQAAYLQSLDWGESPFMTYTVKRSGVTPGTMIHSKVLNHWFKRGSQAIMGREVTLYVGTKTTTITGLKRYMDDESIRRDASGHRTDEAYQHYQHDHLSGQIRAQKTVEKMVQDARGGLKIVEKKKGQKRK